MIRSTLLIALQGAVEAFAQARGWPTDMDPMAGINLERPKQGGFGDYAVNVSPLARYAKMAPPQIASEIAASPALAAWTPQCVGGFINFNVPVTALLDSLGKRMRVDVPGANTRLTDMHVLLEYVSANPTGPLHIGHGRWVALGDSLARIWRHCGAVVTDEFYVNDAGNQMFNIANSIWYRCLEQLGTGGRLPEPVEGTPYPFYPGDYVVELAADWLAHHRAETLAWDSPSHQAPPEAIETIGSWAKKIISQQQQDLMAQCRLVFDAYFSETTLHATGAVTRCIDELKARGMTYEQDGALWFASSRLGDDQDRVLIKSDGSYTYLTADIAYHDEKYRRQDGFYTHIINIWGADHHGYIARMKAAVAALGHDPDRLEILLGQLVNLIIDGEKTRMGKRKKMLTLADLVDEVGVDAVRFWMVSKSQDTALDFNVTLAASATEENPFFYVQYAHARCASILRNAFTERLDTIDHQTLPPFLTESQWQAFLANDSATALSSLFDRLENTQAAAGLRELILKLDSLEDKILEAARLRLPHLLARYALDLAGDFHRFYATCRILTTDPETTLPRLGVIFALKRTIAQTLDLLGVSAPEQM